MKRKLKREEKSSALDKINMGGEDGATFFEPKAEDMLRGWMQNSSVSMEIPVATDKIVRQLQQLAFQRSIKRRRRMVFLWTLFSLVCGCFCIIILPNFMQKDIHSMLTEGVVQNQPYKIIGNIDSQYWILAFLDFIILALLIELLLSSISAGRSRRPTSLCHQPG